jgi:hypothetical protein
MTDRKVMYNIDTRKTTNNGIEVNAEIKNENELKVIHT